MGASEVSGVVEPGEDEDTEEDFMGGMFAE